MPGIISELYGAVSKTVTYMTARFKAGKKELISETEIVRNCFRGRADMYDSVMELALEKVATNLGFKIIEVETKVRNKATIIRKYFVVYEYMTADDIQLTQQEKDYEMHLIHVLVHIIGAGGRCHEGVVWNSLGQMDFPIDRERVLFIVKRTVIDYKNHKYIRTKRRRDGLYFMWGLRAHQEFKYDMYQLRRYSAKVLASKPTNMPN